MLLKVQLSSWSNIEEAVPRCIPSIFGPFLFLIYVNNLSNGLTTNAKLFPADVFICFSVANIYFSVTNFSIDLSEINAWANQWKMSFNLDPNKQAQEITFL